MKKVALSLALATMLISSDIVLKEFDSSIARKSPTNSYQLLSYSKAIKKVQSSVVNISTQKKIKVGGYANSMFNDPFFHQFFGGRGFNIPKDRVQNALGSGVIISQDGYIITNNHVVADADKVKVSISGHKREYRAKVIGTDPKSDIAIIKIEPDKKLNPILFFDSNKVEVGDVVFALGNPFGVGGTVTNGIVSGLNRNSVGINEYEDFIQTDAAINPGNSGGALINSAGALIGINSAIITKSGASNGIGFAIPSNMAKKIALDLIKSGKVVRAYLGVSIGEISSDLAEYYKREEGAILYSVQKDSPAFKAGLKRGDLIIKINDKNVKTASDLKNKIGSLSPKSSIKLTYIRDDKEYKTIVELGSLDESIILSENEINIKGMICKELNDEDRKKLGVPSDINGVYVSSVKDESSANKAGFREGDVIIQLESTEIDSTKELKELTKKDKKQRYFVYRRGVIRVLVL